MHSNLSRSTAQHSLYIRKVPIPTPGAGQVLVKMHTAAFHPSDLMFMRNDYGIRRPLPTTPGFKECGTVVPSGADLGLLRRGKRGGLARQEYGEHCQRMAIYAMQHMCMNDCVYTRD